MAKATDLPLELWIEIFAIAYHFQLHGYLCCEPFGTADSPFAVDPDRQSGWSLSNLAICRHLYTAARTLYLSRVDLMIEGYVPIDTNTIGESRLKTYEHAKIKLAHHPQSPSNIRSLDLGFDEAKETPEVIAEHASAILRNCPSLVSCRIGALDGWRLYDMAQSLPPSLQRLALSDVTITFTGLQVILDLPCLTHLYLFHIRVEGSMSSPPATRSPTELTSYWTYDTPFAVTFYVVQRSPHLQTLELADGFSAPVTLSDIFSVVPAGLSTLRLSAHIGFHFERGLPQFQQALADLAAVPPPLLVDMNLVVTLDDAPTVPLQRLISALGSFRHRLTTLTLELRIRRLDMHRDPVPASYLSQLLSNSLQHAFAPLPEDHQSAQSVKPFQDLRFLSVVTDDQVDVAPTWSEALEKAMVQERRLRKLDGSLWSRQDFCQDRSQDIVERL